jgi:hypothetical protein
LDRSSKSKKKGNAEGLFQTCHAPKETPMNTFALFCNSQHKTIFRKKKIFFGSHLSLSAFQAKQACPQEEENGPTGLSSTTASPDLPAKAGVGLPFASPSDLLLAPAAGADPEPPAMEDVEVPAVATLAADRRLSSSPSDSSSSAIGAQ